MYHMLKATSHLRSLAPRAGARIDFHRGEIRERVPYHDTKWHYDEWAQETWLDDTNWFGNDEVFLVQKPDGTPLTDDEQLNVGRGQIVWEQRGDLPAKLMPDWKNMRNRLICMSQSGQGAWKRQVCGMTLAGFFENLGIHFTAKQIYAFWLSSRIVAQPYRTKPSARGRGNRAFAEIVAQPVAGPSRHYMNEVVAQFGLNKEDYSFHQKKRFWRWQSTTKSCRRSTCHGRTIVLAQPVARNQCR